MNRAARTGALSWGIWAERAVVRALDLDPNETIQAGLLHGQRTAPVTLVIARVVGYLAGTQQAPDLPPSLRAWLETIGMTSEIGAQAGVKADRLGGLSWAHWAERAAILALEIDPHATVESSPLRGAPLWEVAVTIGRAVGYLAGSKRFWTLPPEVVRWLHRVPESLSVHEKAA